MHFFFFAFVQENVKTKHPQLLYESKLYRILQGGSNALSFIYFFFPFAFHFFSLGDNNLHSVFVLQLGFQMSSGLVLRVITMFWLWTYWAQALRISLAFATENCL